MTLPAEIHDFLRGQGWGGVRATRTLGGGCINKAVRIETEHGPCAILKTNHRTPPDMFAREAEGLRTLAEEEGPRVPAVYGYGDDWILIEYLSAAPRGEDYWESMGAGLARLHSVTSTRFGFSHDNYIGSTPQQNPWETDGHTFFAEHRLRFQGRLAYRRKLLSIQDMKRLERVISRLPQLVLAQPASLSHGDLWGGNVITGPGGEPVLIDPAVHYGWAEAELAMTTLFGRFDCAVYDAYQSIRPLDPGYEERFELYNLYHLLNHLNLFGRVYETQVMGILRRYS